MSAGVSGSGAGGGNDQYYLQHQKAAHPKNEKSDSEEDIPEDERDSEQSVTEEESLGNSSDTKTQLANNDLEARAAARSGGLIVPRRESGAKSSSSSGSSSSSSSSSEDESPKVGRQRAASVTRILRTPSPAAGRQNTDSVGAPLRPQAAAPLAPPQLPRKSVSPPPSPLAMRKAVPGYGTAEAEEKAKTEAGEQKYLKAELNSGGLQIKGDQYKVGQYVFSVDPGAESIGGGQVKKVYGATCIERPADTEDKNWVIIQMPYGGGKASLHDICNELKIMKNVIPGALMCVGHCIRGNESEGTLYMVAERMAVDLEKNGDISKCPFEVKAEVTKQACQSVLNFHKAGIVHMDLKPDNFLLGKPLNKDSKKDDVKLELIDYQAVIFLNDLEQFDVLGTRGFRDPATRGLPDRCTLGAEISGRSKEAQLAQKNYCTEKGGEFQVNREKLVTNLPKADVYSLAVCIIKINLGLADKDIQELSNGEENEFEFIKKITDAGYEKDQAELLWRAHREDPSERPNMMELANAFGAT